MMTFLTALVIYFDLRLIEITLKDIYHTPKDIHISD